jgi:hypothetical protein
VGVSNAGSVPQIAAGGMWWRQGNRVKRCGMATPGKRGLLRSPRHKYHSLGRPSDTCRTRACALDQVRVQRVPKWKESRHLRPHQPNGASSSVCSGEEGSAKLEGLLACLGHPHSRISKWLGHGIMYMASVCLCAAGFSALELVPSRRQPRSRSQGPFLKPETSHTAVQQEKHQCPFKKQPSFFCFSAKRFQGVWKKAQNGTRNLID